MNIEPDRPELVVMRLAQLHLRHPEKNFAWIEIAKNPPLELEKEWRMERVAQIEESIRAGEPIEQLATRHSHAAHSRQVVHVFRGSLMEQTIAAAKSVLAQLPLELADARCIFARVRRRGQQLEPDGIEPESAQSQHPLERYRKIAAAFRIFRREAATEEDCHKQRIVGLAFGSSVPSGSFDGPCIIR